MVERQPPYLEVDSPSVQGAQYFVIPPPGLLEVKGDEVLAMLQSLPRRPRSVMLFKKLEVENQLAEEKQAAETLELIHTQLRIRRIDEARQSALKQQAKELMFGRTMAATTSRSGASSKVPILPLATVSVGEVQPVISPITTEARAFLSARKVETSGNTICSPAQRKTFGLIDSMKERIARGEVVAPPKEPKRSGMQRFRNIKDPSRPESGLSERENEDDVMSFKEKPLEDPTEVRLKKEKCRAGSVFLQYFAACRYMLVLRERADFEATADYFRTHPTLTEFLVGSQRRIKIRVRRIVLLNMWIAHGRIVAAVARFKRISTQRRRDRKITMVKAFLTDASIQCHRIIRMKYFRRCVVKAQRFARSFIACMRARVRLLMLRLNFAMKKEDNVALREQTKRGYDILKAPGKHLLLQMVAKLRKAYIKARFDYSRRLRENDTTPAFAEIDIWHVKEYLTSEEEETAQKNNDGGTALPPQYRGNVMGAPIFRLYSRQYIEHELLDLTKTALGIKVDLDQLSIRKGRKAGTRHAPGHKKLVRIREPPPPPPKQIRVKKAKKVTKDKSTGEIVGTDKEAMALIKVLAGRLAEWKKNVALLTTRFPGDYTANSPQTDENGPTESKIDALPEV